MAVGTREERRRLSPKTSARAHFFRYFAGIGGSEDDDRELVGIAIIWGYTLAKGKLWWMITMS